MKRPVINIARLEEKHVPGLHHCIHTIARELDFLAVLYAQPIEELLADARRTMAEGVPRFVAVSDCRHVVGWCDIHPYYYKGYRHRGKLSIGVLREYRRQGLGRRLIAASMHQARILGLERIELEVFAVNTGAIALYESMGFVREGLKVDARKSGTRYDDLLLMAHIERAGT